MSWITFDYTCTCCGVEYPNCLVKRSEVDTQRCGKCGEQLTKRLAAPKTTFRFADGPKKEIKKASPDTTTLKLEK